MDKRGTCGGATVRPGRYIAQLRYVVTVSENQEKSRGLFRKAADGERDND